jgi:xanthine/CO dehydrogenase XdhC/CoxF family maturation factor
MNELGRILTEWTALSQLGQQAVLATVVRVQGSAYRRPGARLLLSEASETTGCVSGGCLEGDLVRRAWWLTRDGPVLRRYDTGADAETGWAFGLGCNGVVDVLLERLDPRGLPQWVTFLKEQQSTRQAAVLVTGLTPPAVGHHICFDAQGRCVGEASLTLRRLSLEPSEAGLGVRVREALRDRRSACETVDGTGYFVEYLEPPRPVLIFGGGLDVTPLVELCAAQGWYVTVVDPRTTSAPAGRFGRAQRVVSGLAWPQLDLTADTMCVVMTHHFNTDREILHRLLSSPVGYIGVLGPRARTEEMLGERAAPSEIGRAERLFGPSHERTFDQEPQRPKHMFGLADERLFAPAGLDLGGDGPHAVALSIVAEMQAVAVRRNGGHLRSRNAPLHQVDQPLVTAQRNIPSFG